jgi:site-specific DNA-cytosine methylase
MWFVKSKRAQTSDDDETWLRGGVAPTLNAFDMGDTRATVIILDGTRVGDVRVYEDSVMQTVIQRWGTGGGNVPAIVFYESGPGYILEVEKTGVIRSEGENRPSRPTHTILQNQMAVDTDNQTISNTNQTLRKGNGRIDHTGGILTVIAFDTFNQTVSDTNQTIKAHSANNENIGTVLDKSTVRRLTPTECERLQGFPDGWTDGQADSHRYKQMGNAVAVPVVEWIINRIIK